VKEKDSHHSHSHSHHHHHGSASNIKIAFFLNLSFTVIELAGGYLTNSVAIVSDALHDLGDSFSLGLAWFLEKYSNKKRTDYFSYGYKRFSLLGAFLNAVILLIGSLFILMEAVPRILKPEQSYAEGMLALAVLGIAVNGFAVWKTAKGKSMNEKVISLHLLEDVLGWIAVFVVSIIMMFSGLNILDPILSLLITLYILWGVVKNLKETLLLFLQAAPKHLDISTVEKELRNHKQVIDIHDTHIWSLDGEHNIFSTHLIIGKTSGKKDIENIKCDIKEILKNMGISHSTLEIEFEDENCEAYCR